MKLTQSEMQGYITEAWSLYAAANADPRAKYRFGQALWNILPDKVTNSVYMSDKDFFYWGDDRIPDIMEVVYIEMVEKV